MPIGPGKYDHVTTEVFRATEARIAMVVVIEGNRGSGFSMQIAQPVSGPLLAALGAALRKVADEIELDVLLGPRRQP